LPLRKLTATGDMRLCLLLGKHCTLRITPASLWSHPKLFNFVDIETLVLCVLICFDLKRKGKRERDEEGETKGTEIYVPYWKLYVRNCFQAYSGCYQNLVP
jgi:hypothetical protein